MKAFFTKKVSPRRTQVRRNLVNERLSNLDSFADTKLILSIMIGMAFVLLTIPLVAFNPFAGTVRMGMLSVTAIIALTAAAAFVYVANYQGRALKNPLRTFGLSCMFLVMLTATKIGYLLTTNTAWATATTVIVAIILTISYNQRFALGMTCFYSLWACLATGKGASFELFLITATAAATCCFSLREIRTRMKLIYVSALAAVMVFVMASAVKLIDPELPLSVVFKQAGFHSVAALSMCLLIQALLPLIEQLFKITTSMTLLFYSDASMPLLRKLALEAPGTYSHSLLVGTISEAAAEAIGRNGLLCRVGAYYHDVGKLNKPGYFIENEMGGVSRHKELSPAMSQLIIVGHVKDGTELAREYNLPFVLRQFVETHHGTTLVEYFYNEARKRAAGKGFEPSENEFRYSGPKPRSKEAAIVMLADAVEGAVRSLPDLNVSKIEAVVHNMAMKRLQDGQLDECDLSLRELSLIESSITKTLAAQYHGRIAYPTRPDLPYFAKTMVK